MRGRVTRAVVIAIIQVISFLVLAHIIPGFSFDSIFTVIVAALVISFLNAFLQPLLLRISFPLTVLTLGFSSLLLNAFMIYLAAALLPGFQLESFWTALWLTIGLAVINTLFSSLFSIDDMDSYYRYVMKTQAQKVAKTKPTKIPGVIFIEIDGLSRAVLQRAIQNAYMPTLSRWLKKTHRLTGWECDLSSQTVASQAGLLHGDNNDIPAFRWYEKDRQKLMFSGSPEAISEVEKRIKNGDGLLSKDGMSLLNMFSGGAKHTVMVASQVKKKGVVKQQSALYFYFLNPYNLIRSLLLSLVDIFHETRDAFYQKHMNVEPRISHGGAYPLLRAATTVIMRDLLINTLIGDIYAGIPAVYTTFVGYDEVAHHSGVERQQAMYVLQQFDKQLAKVEYAVKEAPRPYHLVILSDHGQSQGATFKQRFGYSLKDLVKQLIKDVTLTVGSASDSDELYTHINTMMNEVVQDQKHASTKAVKQALIKQTSDGAVKLRPKDKPTIKEEETQIKEKDLYVLASGNLGLIYFPKIKGRLTAEQIEQRFRGLIQGLAEHEGIGYVMVNSSKHGPIVYGKEGTHYLKTGKIVGISPLQIFGGNAAKHLLRYSTFKHCPDILTNSFYDPNLDEVAAFEGLVGSHGGLGGNQNKPFLLYPKVMSKKPLTDLIGAEKVHRVIREWVVDAQKKD